MRKYVDCRDFPSESKCTVAISSDPETELIDAAVQHAIAVHGQSDTPELRAEIRKRCTSKPAGVVAKVGSARIRADSVRSPARRAGRARNPGRYRALIDATSSSRRGLSPLS